MVVLVLGLMSIFLVMNLFVNNLVMMMGFMVRLALSKVHFLAWLDCRDDFTILLVINLASFVVFHIGRQMFTVSKFHLAIDHLWFWLGNLMSSFMMMMFFFMVLLMNGFPMMSTVMLLFLVLLNHFGVRLLNFNFSFSMLLVSGLVMFPMVLLFRTFLMVMFFHRLLDMFLIKHVLLDMLFLVGFDQIIDVVQVLRVHQSWLLHESWFRFSHVSLDGGVLCAV